MFMSKKFANQLKDSNYYMQRIAEMDSEIGAILEFMAIRTRGSHEQRCINRYRLQSLRANRRDSERRLKECIERESGIGPAVSSGL